MKDDFGETTSHPTFGYLQVARCSGAPRPLFGSSIKHQDTIEVEIGHADLRRGLSSDHHFARFPIVRVAMSNNQFAEAITGIGQGGGVPVTIRWTDKDGQLGETPFDSKVQQFNAEFQEHMTEVAKYVESVIKLAKETKAQKRLLHELDMLKQQLESNIPFVNKQFTKQMEKTVAEAKGEVDAHVTRVIMAYGLEAIKTQAPQIEEAKDIKALKEGKGEGAL